MQAEDAGLRLSAERDRLIIEADAPDVLTDGGEPLFSRPNRVTGGAIGPSGAIVILNNWQKPGPRQNIAFHATGYILLRQSPYTWIV